MRYIMSYYVNSNSFNPYENIALERYLFDTFDGNPILYLWQNKKTVVIGKWQNIYEECNLEEMNKLNVLPARRYTGGGAVYHHLGNLNFTFIVDPSIYDVRKQSSVILNALLNLGIKANFSGRNDLEYEGKKFSGNAFLEQKHACLHHGTILINENKDIITSVLNPKPSKLETKGVKSVKSRIINLAEIIPDITIDKAKHEILLSFEKTYGACENIDIQPYKYFKLVDTLSSPDWLYGKSPTYNFRSSGRTSLGEMDFYMKLENDNITKIKVFSDILDASLVPFIESLLHNTSLKDIESTLSTLSSLGKEISIIIKSDKA